MSEGGLDEFNDSDDLEDNEDDFEALGSILSWDEEAADVKVSSTIAAVKEEDPPPDMVVFTTQDGVPQFNFVPQATADGKTVQQQKETQVVQQPPQLNSVSVPMPLPTPIAGMRTTTPAVAAAPELATAQQQQQVQQPAPFNAAPDANAMAAAFPNAGLFLRQLQFAQLQQQIQAAQVQQQQQQQQPQAVQQFAAPTFPNNMIPFPMVQQAQQQAAQLNPAARMQPLAPKQTKPAPTTKSRATKAKKSFIGTVSASDTEGEQIQVAPVPSSTLDTESMTPTEKAQANRDRNREHARNTRLRKKAYLEKLKTTVDELCRERDTLVSERAAAASLLVEVQTTRTEVLMSLFALRTSNEKRRKLWASILDESRFTCTLPVTPYRSFPASEVQLSRCSRTVQGIDGMMTDTASLHVFLDCLVDRSEHAQGKINIRYTLITEESVVAGNQMMARWSMQTTNACDMGAKAEVSKEGMLCCKFNNAHKITSLEIMFDVMAFMLQLKQATGSDGFPVVPNTVQNCQQSFDKPMVLAMADPPFTIIQVNKQWEDLTGYSSDEVVGKVSCRILQHPTATLREPIDTVMAELRHRRPAFLSTTNVKKGGTALFDHCVVLFPLSTDSRISYYVGLTLHHTAVVTESSRKRKASE